MKKELNEQFKDLTGDVKKISLHKISTNQEMDNNLNRIINTFESFAKLGQLNKSPIDRLFNDQIQFKLQKISQQQAPAVQPPMQIPPGPLPNESMFATNTSGIDLYGSFTPNGQFVRAAPKKISAVQFVSKINYLTQKSNPRTH